MQRSLPNFEYKKSEADPLTPKRIKTETPNQTFSTPQVAYVEKPVVWAHQKFDWLKPDKIRDAQKRRPNEPDYDSRTLFVPESFLQNLTPVSFTFKLFIESVLIMKIYPGDAAVVGAQISAL